MLVNSSSHLKTDLYINIKNQVKNADTWNLAKAWRTCILSTWASTYWPMYRQAAQFLKYDNVRASKGPLVAHYSSAMNLRS